MHSRTATAKVAESQVYSEAEIRRRLPEIAGWDFDGKQLARLFVFPSFPDAVAFVDRLAVAAEQAGHHPDIDIRYDTVRLQLMTHSAKGVTDKDFSLATRINSLA
ncbi:MAG: 4a-hydroxytetrahydrobiopterin dehydratase [Chloroflexi bacterium]|nr:4a-hydroxytetrahydrobiopterin dehydratase [Chloroflexota bacterium]